LKFLILDIIILVV
ncbi:hypothetical protein BAE44_0021716, partial [Dichanthelium oligosanthes]